MDLSFISLPNLSNKGLGFSSRLRHLGFAQKILPHVIKHHPHLLPHFVAWYPHLLIIALLKIDMLKIAVLKNRKIRDQELLGEHCQI
jgi:hypothetical protein